MDNYQPQLIQQKLIQSIDRGNGSVAKDPVDLKKAYEALIFKIKHSENATSPAISSSINMLNNSNQDQDTRRKISNFTDI